MLEEIGKMFLDPKYRMEKYRAYHNMTYEQFLIDIIQQQNIQLKEKEEVFKNFESQIQEIKKINEFKKALEIKNKDIQNLSKENGQLKKEINKLNEKNKNLNEKIKNLSKKDKIIESLIEKENEIKELKTKIQNYGFELKEGDNIINITLMSMDESIIYSLMCKNSDKFIDIEKNLYKKFPELLKSENEFYIRGIKINKYNSLDENKIKDGDILSFYIKINL